MKNTHEHHEEEDGGKQSTSKYHFEDTELSDQEGIPVEHLLQRAALSWGSRER